LFEPLITLVILITLMMHIGEIRENQVNQRFGLLKTKNADRSPCAENDRRMMCMILKGLSRFLRNFGRTSGLACLLACFKHVGFFGKVKLYLFFFR